MTGTRTYEAVDATFVLLVNDAQYRYLETKDGKPFAYFLNPAAYGGGVAKVRWDEATETWVFENGTDTNNPAGTPPASFSYLDDRYTLGAGYGANNLLVSDDQTVTQGYKAPLGTALPASEIKLVDDAGTLKVVVPGFDSVSLTPTFESAEIKPVLILKVYESRLASYDFYAYLGEFEYALDEEADDGISTAESRHTLLEMYTNLVDTKRDFIQTLAQQWVDRLTNSYATGNAAQDKNAAIFNYNLQNFYGDIYDAWADEVSITTSNPRIPAIINIPSLSYYDGHQIGGEKAEEMSSGHLARPHVELPGLTKVVGHEYYGLKSMRGVYTIFPRPEQLDYLANIVTTAVASVTAGLVTGADHLAIVTAALTEQMNVHWYDYFRGSEQKIKIPLTFNSDGTPDETIEVTANVFVGINTQGNLVGQVSYYDGSGSLQTGIAGMGVNLGDVFSYYTGQQDKSQPFPTAYGYVTGPYGTQILVDKDGNKVGYKSDAYSV